VGFSPDSVTVRKLLAEIPTKTPNGKRPYTGRILNHDDVRTDEQKLAAIQFYLDCDRGINGELRREIKRLEMQILDRMAGKILLGEEDG